MAAGAHEPSSTTMTGYAPSSAARHRSSNRPRSLTGITIVASAVPAGTGGGHGWASPASVSRRASTPAAGESTEPANSRRHTDRPASLRRTALVGEPPDHTPGV